MRKVGRDKDIPGITNDVHTAQFGKPLHLNVIGVHINKHLDGLALYKGAQITAHHVRIEDLREAMTGVTTDLFKQATEPS